MFDIILIVLLTVVPFGLGVELNNECCVQGATYFKGRSPGNVSIHSDENIRVIVYGHPSGYHEQLPAETVVYPQNGSYCLSICELFCSEDTSGRTRVEAPGGLDVVVDCAQLSFGKNYTRAAPIFVFPDDNREQSLSVFSLDGERDTFLFKLGYADKTGTFSGNVHLKAYEKANYRIWAPVFSNFENTNGNIKGKFSGPTSVFGFSKQKGVWLAVYSEGFQVVDPVISDFNELANVLKKFSAAVLPARVPFVVFDLTPP